jgi:ABC-type phosphate/phosphonate transport system ATPase subunit
MAPAAAGAGPAPGAAHRPDELSGGQQRIAIARVLTQL